MRYYCTGLVSITNQLWCKDFKKQHKMVMPCNQCLFLIASAHNDIGHHKIFATNTLLSEQYWWPVMGGDICSLVHWNMSRLPAMKNSTIFHGYYAYAPVIRIQVHCSGPLYWPEWAMLPKENAKALGKWILHDIIYCWAYYSKLLLTMACISQSACIPGEAHISHANGD